MTSVGVLYLWVAPSTISMIAWLHKVPFTVVLGSMLTTLWRFYWNPDSWSHYRKCKPSAHSTCSVPLIDGLGQEYAFTHGLHASSSRRVWHGLATQVDSMQESLHALKCDFLTLQGTQSECGKPSAIMHIEFFACFHSILSLENSRYRTIAFFSGSRSSEATGIANRPPRSL